MDRDEAGVGGVGTGTICQGVRVFICASWEAVDESWSRTHSDGGFVSERSRE